MDTLCRQAGNFPETTQISENDEFELNPFPIGFARSVAEILRRDEENIKNGIYNSSNPHPIYKNCKLLAGVNFTDDEVKILANTNGYYCGITIGGLPDGISYDSQIGTFTVPEIKIISNSELYKNNTNLKSATVTFEYYFRDCDTYIGGIPNFIKTFNYLDYRK